MNNLVIASSAADATATAAVEKHHAQLAGALAVVVERLVTAAATRHEDTAVVARDNLVAWCRRELVPHALAEEEAMYPAARAMAEGRLLVDGMLAEHRVITGLVEEIAAAKDPVRAAAAARALAVAFEGHLAKENELVLPLLAAAPEVSVAELLGGMHELLGGHERHEHHDHEGTAGHAVGHHCTCGETDAPGHPELDTRAIPHAIRHATVFGALDAVRPGAALVLVASHDPLPLLAQLEQRAPGEFEVAYRERGPEAWRLLVTRRSGV